MTSPTPLQYNGISAQFRQHAEDSPYNAHYDRPAVFNLLGDVAGRDVLDAACGPGLYLAELIRCGAKVTGFDASAEMLGLARQAVPDGSYFETTLETDLWELPTGSFAIELWQISLTDLCGAATGAGFVITRLIEPRPAESMRQRWPEQYEKWNREPGFLILQLRAEKER